MILNEGRYGYDGLRRTFGDGKLQRIETLSNTILEAFTTWSAAIKAKRIDDERWRQERAEEERRRDERRRKNALENKRVAVLSNNLEQWHKRQRILELVEAVEMKLGTCGGEDPAKVRGWIDWAKRYADQIDPLRVGLPKLLQLEDFKSWELRN